MTRSLYYYSDFLGSSVATVFYTGLSSDGYELLGLAGQRMESLAFPCLESSCGGRGTLMTGQKTHCPFPTGEAHRQCCTAGRDGGWMERLLWGKPVGEGRRRMRTLLWGNVINLSVKY